MSPARSLHVWLYGERAGTLAREGAGFRFTYEEAWVDAGRPALSQSIPVRREPFVGPEVQAFFANLLPEGEVRGLLAREVGVSVDNDFALLEAVGGDCAGAVSLLPPGAPAAGVERDAVRWLDEEGVAEVIDSLPRRPMLADPEGGVRLSLAGAQDKLPVVVRDGRVGVPLGQTPSTHIIKTPIGRLEDTVANEAYCLALGRELGLSVASAAIRSAHGRSYLLVDRYDRVLDDGDVARVHQEDFCQALSLPPTRKYEAEGGPSLKDCFDLVRSAASAPAASVLALLDAVTLNFLVGNHDAHGKNFSLLYGRDGVHLAPVYDVISTAVYPELTRKMAMKLGGEYRPAYVRRRHVERFAEGVGLGPAAVRRRMRRWATVASDVADDVAQQYRESGELRPVVERVADTVAARSSHLERELA